jgi:hypothetical protein
MSKRATRKRIRGKRTELPLDDHRWRPASDLHTQLCRQTSSRDFAAKDLTDLLRTRVRSMRRRGRPEVVSRRPLVFAPERELLKFSFWIEHELLCTNTGLLAHVRGSRARFLYGDVFFFWSPDLKPTPKPARPSTPRLKPGPNKHRDWPKLIRHELERLGPKLVRQLENSGELRENLENFLDLQMGWYPKNVTRLNRVIRAFLKGDVTN